jgi:hypothetical protein
MFEKINRKIEMIREQPEVIRMRYLAVSVAVAMLFVIGVWFLTIQQNFREPSSDAELRKQDVESLVTETKDALKEQTTSLQQLKDSNQTLGTGAAKNATAETFLESQLKAESQVQPASEGVNQGN